MSTRTSTNGSESRTRGTATSKTPQNDTAQAGPQPATTAERFNDAAHRAVDNVTARLAEAERTLREQATDKEESIRDAADQASRKASELKQRTSRYINENPMAAAGIAFAAGILFSAWMRR